MATDKRGVTEFPHVFKLTSIANWTEVRYSTKLEIYTIWCNWDCEPVEDHKDGNKAYQRCEELNNQ